MVVRCCFSCSSIPRAEMAVGLTPAPAACQDKLGPAGPYRCRGASRWAAGMGQGHGQLVEPALAGSVLSLLSCLDLLWGAAASGFQSSRQLKWRGFPQFPDWVCWGMAHPPQLRASALLGDPTRRAAALKYDLCSPCSTQGAALSLGLAEAASQRGMGHLSLVSQELKHVAMVSSVPPQ